MKLKVSFLILLSCFITKMAFSANWYVTQSGAGSKTGALGNEWSVANFNSSSSPAAGDTVFFSGAITSTIVPKNNGSTGHPITLDFSAATLNTANPRIQINAKSYLNIFGGSFGVGNATMFDFNHQNSHDIYIANWASTNTDGSQAAFVVGWACYNLTISNCICQGYESLYYGATTNSHDILIINNSILGSTNIIDQTDLISGDPANVTIQGNYLVNRAPGGQSNGHHNDCIQCYKGGEGGGSTPTGWVVRYNWVEQDQQAGDGSTSFMMMENMVQNGSSDACDIYGNVFVFGSGTIFSGNGVTFDSNDSAAIVRFYNNTVINYASAGGSPPGGPTRFLSPGILYAENNAFEASASESGLAVWTFTIAKSDYNRFYNYSSPSSTYTGPHGAANSNPLFNNYTGGDYSLSSSSPCRGVGDNTLGSPYNMGIAPGATWPNPQLIARTGAWDVGAFVFPVARTVAANWYVDGHATGSDNGTSWANAWTSINQITNLIAGDVVYISGGPTNSSEVYQVPNGWSPYGGGPTNPIIYQIGQDTQHDGTAVFDCNGGTWINVIATNNFTVNGNAGDGNMHFALTNCDAAIQAEYSTNVAISYVNMGSVNGADAIDIANTGGINIGYCSAMLWGDNVNYFCEAGNLKNTTFGQSSIHDCAIYLPRDNSSPADPNGARGIHVSGTGLDISNNVFVGYSTNYNNTSLQQFGVLLDDGSYFVRAVNNKFVNMASYAVLGQIISAAGNIYVANNICALTDPALIDYDLTDSSTFGAIVINSQGLSPSLANIAVANNIAVDYTNSVTFGLYKGGSISSTFINCMLANNINLGGGNSTNDPAVADFDDVNITNTQEAAANIAFYTPFGGTNNNLQPLATASLIVNKGTNLISVINVDVNNNPRPTSGNWNIGPFQSVVAMEPVISNVQFSPNADTATITWMTDEAADSIVNYGLTSSYGMNVTDSSSVTSHSVTLSGLIAGATYHFQVESIAGTDTNSSVDYTFVALAALTVNVDNQVRGYGQSNPVLTGSVSANGDDITASFTTTAETGSPVGNYPITVILNDPGGKLGNYAVTINNGTLTVTNALLTVTANNANKVYGQTLAFAGTEFTVSGLVNADSVSGVMLTSAGGGAAAGAGTYPISITNAVGDDGLTNYLITYVPGTLTVNPAALTVSADNQVRSYGQGNPTLTGTVSANGDGITANFTTAADMNSPVGNYPITAVLNDPNGKLGNYVATTNNGTLTVTNALLTVAANNANKVYGQTLTFAGTEFTASGLVSTDSVNSAILSSAGTNAAAGVGTYPISITNAVGDNGLTNYLITYVPGTLTVNPAGSPQISQISQSPSDVDSITTGVQVYQGMTVQYSVSLLDSGGDTVFWQWGYTVDGGPTNFVLNGTGTISDVSFTYTNGAAGSNYLWLLVASNSTASVTSSLAVNVEPPPPPAPPITFSVKSGVVSSPLIVTNGIINGAFASYIYQPTQTTSVSGAGSAAYDFNITNAGNYVVQALVEPPSESANSFFLDIDAQPADPTNIWDVYPVNTSFEEVFVSWRGTNADPSDPQFNPVVFNLGTGMHQLFLYGREADAYLANFSLIEILVNPVVPPIEDQTVALGQTLSFTVSATDTNPPSQNALHFSLGAGAPPGASINPTNGFFSWSPTNAPGTNAISVIVTDAAGMSVVQTFSVNVVPSPELNENLSPDGGQFALSWLPSETNYTVYMATNLASPWSQVTSTVQSNNGIFYLTVPTANGGQQFFRLQSQ